MLKNTTSSRRHTANATKPDNRKYSIVIPASGIGSRMRSYGAKSLLKCDNNKTLLDNQLERIHSVFPNAEVILVYGFDGARVEKYYRKSNVKLVYNENYENNNVLSSIGLGLEACKSKRVLIIYGDLIFNESAIRVPFDKDSMIIADSKNGLMDTDEVGLTYNNHWLEHMMYNLPTKWAQIAYFCGLELDLLKSISTNKEYEMYFGFEGINKIMDAGGKFLVHSPPKIKAIDVDCSKDLILGQDILCHK